MGPREYYEELPSTQERAIDLARRGATVGTRVVAGRQSAGRGRLDHGWASPTGGLYLSMILPAPVEHEGLLPLALGVAILGEFTRRFGVPLRLKWPNDLLAVAGVLRPRKLSGIVVDRVASPSLGTAAVAGIGVNVEVDERDLPAELRGRIASLHEFAPRPLAVGEVEEVTVEAVLRASRDLAVPERETEIVAACRAALYGIGRRAWIDGRPMGVIRGLGVDGTLLLDHGTDRVSIRAGDLRVEEAV